MDVKQWTMEPDRAKVYVVNLINAGRKFVLEQDEEATDLHGGSLKDVVCIALDATFQERPESHLYARSMTFTSNTDMKHFAVNSIQSGLSFAAEPREYPDGRREWNVTVERHRKHYDARKRVARGA